MIKVNTYTKLKLYHISSFTLDDGGLLTWHTVVFLHLSEQNGIQKIIIKHSMNVSTIKLVSS